MKNVFMGGLVGLMIVLFGVSPFVANASGDGGWKVINTTDWSKCEAKCTPVCGKDTAGVSYRDVEYARCNKEGYTLKKNDDGGYTCTRKTCKGSCEMEPQYKIEEETKPCTIQAVSCDSPIVTPSPAVVKKEKKEDKKTCHKAGDPVGVVTSSPTKGVFMARWAYVPDGKGIEYKLVNVVTGHIINISSRDDEKSIIYPVPSGTWEVYVRGSNPNDNGCEDSRLRVGTIKIK